MDADRLPGAECGLAPIPEIHRLSPGALARAIVAGALVSTSAGIVALLSTRAAGLLLLFLTPLAGMVIAGLSAAFAYWRLR